MSRVLGTLLTFAMPLFASGFLQIVYNVVDMLVVGTTFTLLLSLEDPRTVFVDGDLEIPIKDRARQMEKRLKEKSSVELKLRRKKCD